MGSEAGSNERVLNRAMNLKTLILPLLFIVLQPLSLRAQARSVEVDSVEKKQLGLFGELLKLAKDEFQIGNKKLSDSLALIYKANYLDTLCDSLLFTRNNLRFISDFPELVGSRDRFFIFLFKYPEQADELIGAPRGYARDVVKYFIQREEIDAYLYKGDKLVTRSPDWDQMFKRISAKYDEGYAKSIVPAAEFNFYRSIGDWKKYASLFSDKIKERPPGQETNSLGGGLGDSWTLNSNAWDIFQYCNDKAVLKIALTWSDLSISLCKTEYDAVQYLDTKANILYKLGNQASAIQFEERALALSNKSREYESNLQKMKQGKPTWPTE